VLLIGFKLLKDIGGIWKRSVVFHQLLLGYSPIVILLRGLAQSVEGWVAEWEVAGTIVVAGPIFRFLKILRKKVTLLPCQLLDHNVARMITLKWQSCHSSKRCEKKCPHVYLVLNTPDGDFPETQTYHTDSTFKPKLFSAFFALN